MTIGSEQAIFLLVTLLVAGFLFVRKNNPATSAEEAKKSEKDDGKSVKKRIMDFLKEHPEEKFSYWELYENINISTEKEEDEFYQTLEEHLPLQQGFHSDIAEEDRKFWFSDSEQKEAKIEST